MCNAHKQSVGTHIQKSFITKVDKLLGKFPWASLWTVLPMTFGLPKALSIPLDPFGAFRGPARSDASTQLAPDAQLWKRMLMNAGRPSKRTIKWLTKDFYTFLANQFSSKSGSQILKILVAVTISNSNLHQVLPGSWNSVGIPLGPHGLSMAPKWRRLRLFTSS